MLALARQREPSAKELKVGDVMPQRIRSLAFKIQKLNVGASEMDTQCHDFPGELQKDQVQLSKF